MTSCPRMLDEGSTTGEPTSIERTVENHTRKCGDGSDTRAPSSELAAPSGRRPTRGAHEPRICTAPLHCHKALIRNEYYLNSAPAAGTVRQCLPRFLSRTPAEILWPAAKMAVERSSGGPIPLVDLRWLHGP
jgi:hypothetical protein